VARAIFISYRRDDTEGEAGRLFDDLTRTFGEDSVFMDVAGINPGLDFRKAIDDNVATCGVLLAMIGPTWTTIANGEGHRRLDDENDFVRLEIASALARNVAVIPVLVHDAKMPHPDQLPDNLKDLAYRNSVEITHARWNSDVQLLTKALSQYVTSSSFTSTEPVHATVSVQLPPPNAPREPPAAVSSSKTPLIAGIAVVVLILAAVGYFVFGRSHEGSSPSTVATTPPTQPAASSATQVTPAGVAAPSNSPLAGVWLNPATVEHNDLKKLEISGTGNQVSMHAWSSCHPTDCDWGAQTSAVNGVKATATWSFLKEKNGEDKGRVATLTAAADNGKLNVTVVNTFPKHPGNQRQFELERAD
jgi:hypothetical protein